MRLQAQGLAVRRALGLEDSLRLALNLRGADAEGLGALLIGIVCGGARVDGAHARIGW